MIIAIIGWIVFVIEALPWFMLIFICLVGGSISYETEGLFPKLDRWKREREERREAESE